MSTAKPSKAAALLHSRYGDAAPPPGPINEVITLLLSHRSVRAFLPRTLPESTLEMLVAAAQSASTSSNMQAWSVVAVEEAERKSRLATLAGNQEFIRQAPLFLAFIADHARLQEVGAAKGTKLAGLDYTESFIIAALDAALAAQNLMVAAESFGLGCVYVGALRNHPEEIAAELGLPSRAMGVFGMAIGYPDPIVPAEVKPRLPQSLVLHRERYDASLDAGLIAAYDETLSTFSATNGMGAADWSARVVGRLATTAGLHGREHIRDQLRTLGFQLR